MFIPDGPHKVVDALVSLFRMPSSGRSFYRAANRGESKRGLRHPDVALRFRQFLPLPFQSGCLKSGGMQSDSSTMQLASEIVGFGDWCSKGTCRSPAVVRRLRGSGVGSR